MTRKVYVLMWIEPGEGNKRARAMFATTTRKRSALRHAKRLQATVYPVPYPGTGWDCPTVRAIFDPIYPPTHTHACNAANDASPREVCFCRASGN